MQDNMDIVRLYYRAIDQGDLKRAGQFLDDDFERFGLSTGPIGKQETLDVLRRLQDAMPDFRHALSNLTANGRVVSVTIQAGGRHMKPLNLAQLGMGIPEGVVPGSGRVVIFEPENLEYTVVNGRITAERNVTQPTVFNGPPGFIKAIGYSG